MLLLVKTKDKKTLAIHVVRKSGQSLGFLSTPHIPWLHVVYLEMNFSSVLKLFLNMILIFAHIKHGIILCLTMDLWTSFSKLKPTAKMSLNLFKISLCLAISVDKMHLQNNNNKNDNLSLKLSNNENIFLAIWGVTVFHCEKCCNALQGATILEVPETWYM